MSARTLIPGRAARLHRNLLHRALWVGLYGLASPALQAQQGAPEPAAETALDCDDASCRDKGELLFTLRSRSYDEPVSVGTSARSSSEALQPDRRVGIELQEPGKATAMGRFMIRLPDGGAIWATEDPAMGTPELSISAPSLVAFDQGRILSPVSFFVRGNYTAFIQRLQVTIYRASDSDLVSPLASVDIPVAAVGQSAWDGKLPASVSLRTGDSLLYVLRAYDAQGNVDETLPQSMQLATPAEVERGNQQLRDALEKGRGVAVDAGQAEAMSLLDRVFDSNGLRQQNIPVYGSRVRLRGRDLPEGSSLKINGESYPLDQDRKFAAEYLMPIGEHAFDVSVERRDQPAIRQTLHVDVSGKYLFGVGLADITVYQNKASGPGRDLAQGERNDDVLSDGRLAFYLKAKMQGRYLLTAQADTQNRPLEDLFDGFTNADPRDLFRTLDPDLYYPTYGDDSLTYRDVDTMGRFYLRLDWDKNQALWGNYNTGFTGTEYAQYVRSLYGAALSWRSRDANAWGDARSELRVFGSQAETAPGHSEFIGTGGSLYYLRHANILGGSDQLVLEIRDRTTGRTEKRVTLVRGADYEIDAIQGRILLTRPLAQVTRENLRTITRDVPLDGYEQRLIADYEWVPTGFDADDIAAGVRGKQWLGDHVAVGGTWVEEQRAGQDYSIKGADLTLQAGRGTYLKMEHSRSEATGTPVFFSDNGGLSFTRINPVGPREGEASAVEGRINLRELGWTEQDWSAGAWWREVDEGYSVGRFDTGQRIREHGAEVLGYFTDDISLYARYSQARRGGESLTQAQLTGEWRIGDNDRLSGEVRRVQEERASGDVAGVLAAARYTHRFGTALDVYGGGQLTVDDDGGRYEDNDAVVVGGLYNFANLSTVGAEATHGDRGNAAQVNAEYKLTPQHSFYGAFTQSTDRSEYDPLFNPNTQDGWTLGQRWRLSDQVNVFNESQFLKSRQESGLAHTFGMDFYPAVGWNAGFTLSDGDLDNLEGGHVDRKAVSVSGGRTSPDTEWQSKLEWRRDTGAERRTQWVSTNRLSHKLNESWRIAGRFNYADTDDRLNPAAGARFIEGNLGFAYRPWNSDRWALFGRYSYLYDLSTMGQVNGVDYDQRTQVLSLEGVYRIDQRWEVAGKLARREGEMRYGRGQGQWFDSATNFAAAQLRYELVYQWHGLAEYRLLDVRDGGTRQGWLVGVDRDVTRNLRVGVGYNFTDFSDDLTDFDYDQRGWYLNLVGRY
ncbi:TonB-dependent receptor [Pseudomonas sp. Hp2]|uniref:TonB-dependent receptor n=1 Tax=Pseudomonas sp. Hp2 TaxID=701189 RepID=UPI00112C3828|nr:TonB-dependent receptor [Pseudomonas sp. Hp2]